MEKPEYEATFRLEDSHWWFVGMRRIIDSLLARQRLPQGGWGRILDAGCGTGGNLAWLSRYGREVINLDISSTALTFFRQRGGDQIILASVTDLPFGNSSFDAVSCFDVLNHLPPGEDTRALAEFQRVLRPGGLLVLRVPAYQWLASGHDEVIHSFHRYSAGEVARKLVASGLRPLRLTYANTILFPLATARRLLQKWGISKKRSDLVPIPRPLNSAFLKAMTTEAWLVSRLRLPFGLSLIALGQRPPL